ncbi:MAG: ABC transporter permease [Verrucomicrobiota bacterium]
MNFGTEIREGLIISWGAIRANKMRSGLTTLGIVIGIVTVTLMGTAIEGLNRAFLKSISVIGTDVLYVQRFGWFIDSYEEWMRANKRREITLPQIKALEKQMTLARAIAPAVDMFQPVKYRNRNASSVHVIGTTDQFLLTGGVSVALGRFLTAAEAEGGRPVCVVGSEVATNLFQLEPPLGKRIKVGPRSFEVVGVLEKQGNFLGAFSLDNQVIIPVHQFMSGFWNYPDFQIQVKVSSVDQLEDAKEELRGLMRKIRRVPPDKPDDFAINQQDQFIKTFNRVAGIIASVGLFITGLSLFVGGIGIMNIMFVSVAERTREIGIRKAIGAKRRTILLQFLIEAASICLLGGLVGLGIAYPLTLVMARFLPATMSLTVLGIALLVSLLTGVAAGFFPAWRAARMNPVDALRNE